MLTIEGATVEFRTGWRTKPVRALDGVDLSMRPGEICGLCGPSGCGKTTLARLIVGLLRPSAGRVTFHERDVGRFSGKSLREYRRRVQLVFQNPQLALDPRQTVFEILAEPLKAHHLAQSGRQLNRHIEEALHECGLNADILGRRPHQISGGQAQRVALARSLSVGPSLVIGDEFTAMLDVSVQAQVLDILRRRREKRGLAILLISHDVDLVRAFCDTAAILAGGRIVARGDPRKLLPADLAPPNPIEQESRR
jgi:ABC-type glutathione transport system ATPase component